jgi:hypothetical protein
MNDPKSANVPASTPDQLIDPGIKTSSELPDKALDSVTGGDAAKVETIKQDVTVNKAKTADKAFSAMDGYIRG